MPPPFNVSPSAHSKLYPGDGSVETSISGDSEHGGADSKATCTCRGGVSRSLESATQVISGEGHQRHHHHHYFQQHCHGEGKSVSASAKGSNPLPGGGVEEARSSTRSKRMGNGASSHYHFNIDGESMDVHKVKALVPELRNEIKRRDKIIEQYDSQVRHRDELIREKDGELTRLREEVHKLKSVLQLKVDTLKIHESRPDLLSTIDDNQNESSTVSKGPAKKQGVSGESTSSKTLGYVDLTHHEKDFK